MHLSYYVASKTVRTKFFSLNAIRIDGLLSTLIIELKMKSWGGVTGEK